MSKKPLKATDRRRDLHNHGIKDDSEVSETGEGKSLFEAAAQYHGRNGHGRRAF